MKHEMNITSSVDETGKVGNISFAPKTLCVMVVSPHQNSQNLSSF